MTLPFTVEMGQCDSVPLGLRDVQQAVLMNRQEYTFVLTASQIPVLLELLQGAYRVLTIEGAAVHQYYNRYSGTERFECYFAYQNGRPERHKVRWRQYVSTDAGFLELKKAKYNRTFKTRVAAPQPDQLTESDFLSAHSIDAAALWPVLDISYDRVTLVRTHPTPERLTLDFNLRLTSTASGLAHRLGLRAIRLSKYGVGFALHYPHLRCNRLLPQLRQRQRIQAGGC